MVPDRDGVNQMAPRAGRPRSCKRWRDATLPRLGKSSHDPRPPRAMEVSRGQSCTGTSFTAHPDLRRCPDRPRTHLRRGASDTRFDIANCRRTNPSDHFLQGGEPAACWRFQIPWRLQRHRGAGRTLPAKWRRRLFLGQSRPGTRLCRQAPGCFGDGGDAARRAGYKGGGDQGLWG
ncbi:hypothetical protein D9M72_550440 [compost metagenome]